MIKRIHDLPHLLGPAPVMKASLIISFVFHIILLLAFQEAFPSYWPDEELRTYRVDLIRPPVEDADSGDGSENWLDNLYPDKASASDETQDTISLDTTDRRYVSYAQQIKRKIMRNWRYPPEARAYLMEGTLAILFSLSRDGQMTRMVLTRTSGHEILDQEVIRAIKKSAPFPRFPASITVNRLNINARFDYHLSKKRDKSGD